MRRIFDVILHRVLFYKQYDSYQIWRIGSFLGKLLVSRPSAFQVLTFPSSFWIFIEFRKYDHHQTNTAKASPERPSDASSSWDAFQFRQSERSED